MKEAETRKKLPLHIAARRWCSWSLFNRLLDELAKPKKSQTKELKNE